MIKVYRLPQGYALRIGRKTRKRLAAQDADRLAYLASRAFAASGGEYSIVAEALANAGFRVKVRGCGLRAAAKRAKRARKSRRRAIERAARAQAAIIACM